VKIHINPMAGGEGQEKWNNAPAFRAPPPSISLPTHGPPEAGGCQPVHPLFPWEHLILRVYKNRWRARMRGEHGHRKSEEPKANQRG